MNKDEFAGKWHEFKGKIKEKWGKLTDDDITQINGKLEQLSGKLQKKYGWEKEQTEREINHWCTSCRQRTEEGMEIEEKNRFYEELPRIQHEAKIHREENWGASKKQHEKKHSEKDTHKDKKRKAG